MSASNGTATYGDDFYDGHKHNDVFDACVLFSTVISAISSLIVLLLLIQIYVINKQANAFYSNTFLSLLFYITIYQLVYDISFYYGVLGSYSANAGSLILVMNMGQIVGGIASSFYSNVMAYTILHVVWFRSVVDMGDWRCSVLVHSAVLLPALANASLYIVAYQRDSQGLYNTANLDVYYVLRLISIFVNFVIYFATLLSTSTLTQRFSSSAAPKRQTAAPLTMVLRNMVMGRRTNNGSRTESDMASDELGDKRTGVVDDAIATLVSRLKYYPLIQALARSGLTIYEYLYDWDFVVEGHIGRTQFALQIYSALVAPSASVGYLVIFLVMQPRSFFYLKGWLKGQLYLNGSPPPESSTKTILTKKSSKRNDYYADDGQRISYECDSDRSSVGSVESFSDRSEGLSGRLLNGDFRSSSDPVAATAAATVDGRSARGDAAPLVDARERSDDELLRIIVTYDASRPNTNPKRAAAEGSWRHSGTGRMSAAMGGFINRISGAGTRATEDDDAI